MTRFNWMGGLALVALVAACGPAGPSSRLDVHAAPGASAPPELRGRIGPVFADETRSGLPSVGAGSSGGRGDTGIAQGAVALIRRQGPSQRVALFDARSGAELTPGPAPDWLGPAPPRVSADGKQVAYLTLGPGRQELVLWDVESRQRVLLPSLAAADVREPDMSGDGRRLIYLTGANAAVALRVYDRGLDEAWEVPLQKGQLLAARSPTLSADGMTAAYVAASNRGDANIYVVDLRTGRPISPPTLNTVDQERDPALNADGSVLMFTSDRNGSFDLFAYDLRRGLYLDAGAFNSLADETQPRFLGLGDEGVAYVTTRDGGPTAYMHPFRAWR